MPFLLSGTSSLLGEPLASVPDLTAFDENKNIISVGTSINTFMAAALPRLPLAMTWK